MPTPGSDAWDERIIAVLHAERDGVRESLAAQQTRLDQAEATLEELIAQFEKAVEDAAAEGTDHAADGTGDLGYQRRYEMALDDLRELKANNSLLQEQLSKARSTAATSVDKNQTQHTSLNWETEKLRILAALESDLDENDSEQRAERLKIEDVLRTTENVVAEKNDEIQELKRRLEECAGVNSVVQAAAAVEQVLQRDTAIQEERERLRQLDEQLQSRLRQAEVELSLERAKLARERAELDERSRKMGSDAAKAPAGPDATGAAEQPTRGRWLSRLGLTDADREHGRHR